MTSVTPEPRSEMPNRRRLPWGVALCGASAFVSATPSLFLRADVSTSVRAAVIAAAGALFVAGVARLRIETRPRDDSDRRRPNGAD